MKVLDGFGRVIPEVQLGYKIIPDFPKYEINAKGVIRSRNVHRRLKTTKGLDSWVSLSSNDGVFHSVRVRNILDICFPGEYTEVNWLPT